MAAERQLASSMNPQTQRALNREQALIYGNHAEYNQLGDAISQSMSTDVDLYAQQNEMDGVVNVAPIKAMTKEEVMALGPVAEMVTVDLGGADEKMNARMQEYVNLNGLTDAGSIFSGTELEIPKKGRASQNAMTLEEIVQAGGIDLRYPGVVAQESSSGISNALTQAGNANSVIGQSVLAGIKAEANSIASGGRNLNGKLTGNISKSGDLIQVKDAFANGSKAKSLQAVKGAAPALNVVDNFGKFLGGAAVGYDGYTAFNENDGDYVEKTLVGISKAGESATEAAIVAGTAHLTGQAIATAMLFSPLAPAAPIGYLVGNLGVTGGYYLSDLRDSGQEVIGNRFDWLRGE